MTLVPPKQYPASPALLQGPPTPNSYHHHNNNNKLVALTPPSGPKTSPSLRPAQNNVYHQQQHHHQHHYGSPPPGAVAGPVPQTTLSQTSPTTAVAPIVTALTNGQVIVNAPTTTPTMPGHNAVTPPVVHQPQQQQPLLAIDTNAPAAGERSVNLKASVKITKITTKNTKTTSNSNGVVVATPPSLTVTTNRCVELYTA
ncbi:probable serine/threonine-protein kinase DDB_G0280111 [Musca vetustissima]|uniref:probable serine/threonine-protein kinase DDB_G0280111 n=1 Tax=Musca vetustissima TaxID=27455 RepID=UPI002AB6ED57|nr:probable serine/threonine-protein kinase DDB_G0280111 [Musca vetustissima]